MSTPGARPSSPPVTRLWTPGPGALLELWRHEGPRTLRAMAFFAGEDLDYRPRPEARSIGELLSHVVDSYDLTRHWLTASLPPPARGGAAARTVAAAGERARAAQAGLFAALAGLDEAAFEEVIAPFGTPETRGVMALGMLKHELHHRGELHALARVRGRAVAGLYDRIEEPPR